MDGSCCCFSDRSKSNCKGSGFDSANGIGGDGTGGGGGGSISELEAASRAAAKSMGEDGSFAA